MAKEKKAAWFRMCLHQRALMDAVPDETLGKALKAVMLYFDEGQTQSLAPLENAVFQALKPWVDMATEDYKQSVENGKKASRKKAEDPLTTPEDTPLSPTHKDKETEKEEDTDKEVREKEKESVVCKPDKPAKRTRFVPPKEEDVLAYCEEKGYQVDAQRFVDYYTSNGWCVGRSHMKDWKAAVRNWNRKEKPHGKTESNPAWTVGTQV